jgi:hypothetical protein
VGEANAGSHIEQRALPGVADAPANRGQPVLVERGGSGDRPHFDRGDIGLDAKHELINLPVVAGLHAAHDAAAVTDRA